MIEAASSSSDSILVLRGLLSLSDGDVGEILSQVGRDIRVLDLRSTLVSPQILYEVANSCPGLDAVLLEDDVLDPGVDDAEALSFLHPLVEDHPTLPSLLPALGVFVESYGPGEPSGYSLDDVVLLIEEDALDPNSQVLLPPPSLAPGEPAGDALFSVSNVAAVVVRPTPGEEEDEIGGSEAHGWLGCLRAVLSAQSNLVKLELFDVELDLDDVPLVLEAVTSPPLASSLTRLSLEMNSIGDGGIRELVGNGALASLPSLLWLNLNCTDCGVEGAKAIGSFVHGGCSITSLSLYANERIGDAGVEALVRAASGGKRKGGKASGDRLLGSLDLGACDIGSPGLKCLVNSPLVVSPMYPLRVLRLNGNVIDDAGATSLASALSAGATTSLTSVDLISNELTDAGVQALSVAASSLPLFSHGGLLV